MASQLSAKLSLDVAGYEKGLNDAKQSTEQYKTQLGDLSKKFPSMRKEMAQTKKAVFDMEVAWRSMSDAQKKSFEGQELQRQLQTLKERGAELKDAIMDVNQEMTHMASDTRQLDAVKQGFDVLGNSISLAANAYAAFTGDNEDAKRALTIFAGVQSTVNTLTALQNALQEQSSFMLGITTVQQKLKTAATNLDTAATGKNIVVTKGATVAQWALNLAAEANPYVLLASAVLAAGAAVYAYTKYVDSATDAEKMAKQTKEAYIDELKNQASELASNEVKLFTLKREWMNLRTEGEKTQWIKDNQAEFKQLGVDINGISDAENLLVKNTPAFIMAMKARAEAAAHNAVAVQMLNKANMGETELENFDTGVFNTILERAKQGFKNNPLSAWGGIPGLILSTMGKSDAEIINHAKAELHNNIVDYQVMAQKELDKAMKATEKYQKILAANNFKETSTTNTTNTTNTSKTSKTDTETTVKEVKGSLAELEKNLSDFQDKYKKGLLPSITPEEYRTQVKEMQEAIKDMKIVLGIEIEPEEGSANYFKGKISELENELGGISIYVDGEVNPEFIDKLNEIKILKEQALTPDEKLQKQLEESQAKEAEYYRNKAAEQENEKKLLKEKADEQMQIYDAIGQSARGVGSIMSSLSQLAEDDSFNTAGIIMEAIANVALSFATALKTCKHWTEWLAFGISGTAQMFSMISAIKQATKGYANGGVIEGPFHTGDRMLARVNSGEMILNNRQQRNLFDAIDNGKLQGSNNSFAVESFKVRGSDLYLTMKNYEKTTGKKL